MNQCVPSWDLEDISPNRDVFKFDYEVAELTWENGQLAMHELGHRRVPFKSPPTTSWDKTRAAETLETIVNQATQQPCGKTQAPVNNDELVPWQDHHTPGAATVCLNPSATMTSDALVPSSNNKLNKNGHDAGCSTRVCSCSGDQSSFVNRRVIRGGGTAAATHHRNKSREQSVSRTRTCGTVDTYDGGLDGGRVTSTSTGSPENTSSGKDCSKSTSPDDSVCHRRTQRDIHVVKEKKRGKSKASLLNKRRRTAAIHNQSERNRRDKINQKMKTLQNLVPNSSKMDKASMLDEVIEYVKRLQAQVQMMGRMNIPQMMMPLAMQHQQMQMPMMNSMGMGMGMGMGMNMNMNMGGMDPNMMGRANSVGFHPSGFMYMPYWNGQSTNQMPNAASFIPDPMSAFMACGSQPTNMDAYSKMGALYQHMQNKPSGTLPKN